MHRDILYGINEWIIGLSLFVALLVVSEISFRLGRRAKHNPDASQEVSMTVTGGILAMLGLVLGFTFAMAMSRYELRTELVVVESNAIGTAYLRTSFLPEPFRDQERALLREYLDVRMEFYADRTGKRQQMEYLTKALELQPRFWAVAVEGAAHNPDWVRTQLLFSALNDVIDSGARRVHAARNHVPEAALYILFIFAPLALAAIGYRYGVAQSRHFVLVGGLALAVSFVISIIVDLDRPRQGLVQVNEQSLFDVRETIAHIDRSP
jgi:hypothetical protein